MKFTLTLCVTFLLVLLAAAGNDSVVIDSTGTVTRVINLKAASTLNGVAIADQAYVASHGGSVTSVFGRTGPVVATSGDYTAAQVGAMPAITGMVQGSVCFYNGSNWIAYAPGTAGQVFTTQGTGANPTWSAIISAISDTSYNGSNWTSTLLSPTQRAVMEQIPATSVSQLVAGDKGRPVCVMYSGSATITSGGLARWTLINTLGDSFGSYTLTNGGLTFSVDGAFPLGSRYVAIMNGSASASFTETTLPTGASPWSALIWFKTSVSTAALTTMSFGHPNSSKNGIALQLADDGSGRFYLNRYDSSYYSTATVDDGAWHFAAATYDGTTLKLYIDGVLQGSGVAVTMALDQTYSSGGMIGDMGNYGYFWNGSLSDGRIYNRALSLLEVQTIYAGDMGAVAKYDKSTSSAAQNLGSRLATTPTIAAGAGAGSSPTIAVAGSDSSFQITLTTGSAPTGSNATIATVTFASTMPNTAYCVLTPANANAAALTGATQVFASTTTAALTLTSGATALSATTAYVWNVHTF